MQRATHVLADGIYFGECPRWHDGRFWFSDFFAHAVKSVSLAGDLRTEFQIDDQPSGLGWMPDGSMLIVSMKKCRLLRRTSDGKITLHAQLPLHGFRSNDLTVDSLGRAYVGNYGFDLDAALLARGVASVIADHPTAQLSCLLPDGTVTVAAEGLHFPNGSVITPDGRTLIVGETLAGALSAFDICSDGTLINRRVWAHTWPRVPDGIALDAEGHIWMSNPLAPECVLVAEGGAVLEVIETGQPCYACVLGGADGRTLLMLTAPTSVTPDPDEPPRGKLLTAQVDVPRSGYPEN